MRFSLITLAACIFLGTQVLADPTGENNDDGDFCIYFYKKPHHVDQAGVICGSLDEGGHLGRTSANMPVVASLTAPDWMQITLFSKKFFKGKSKILQGDQDNISPTLNVQSLKLDHK